MKNHTNGTGNTNILRRVIVLVASIFTAIAVAIVCALCINVESPIVDRDEVGGGDALTSTTYSNLQNDQTAPGALKNGDVINYSFKTSGYYQIKLPRGQYTLQVWGAQGGYYVNSCLGGKGGYTYATYNVTSTSGEYIYIYVGGQGASGSSGAKSGGYNGGGSVDRANGGGGGGGATHMALAQGTLDALSSTTNQAKVLVVAGGGGGSTTNAHGGSYGQGGYGGGANNNGGSSSGGYITGGGYQASGGKSNQGGSAGRGASASDCRPVTGQAGYFGHGGASYSGGYEAGGGGGGGWYGGGGGGGDSNGSGADGRTGGGGGSGHIKSGLSGGGSNGTQSGNGKATIQVVSVNQGPTARNGGTTIQNASSANYYRGTSRNIDIAASTIAYDPDYTNISGGNTNNVFYSNGTSGNFDALPSANAGLWLNSGCTVSASSYLSWNWQSKSTLRITEIKKYPRAGDGYASTNGKLPLYVKMRDDFGATATRGTSTILFYLVVNDRAITPKADASTHTYSSGGKSYEYRYGDATSNNVGGNYMGTPGSIYNPNYTDGSHIKTVFLPKPIAPTDTAGYTIYAKDIFDDLDTNYDKVGFRTITPLSAYSQYSQYYSISYNTSSDYASGVAPSITIKPTNIRPNGAVYVCATIYAQTSETNTKAVIGSQNSAVQLVFRLANTRPYFASSTMVEGMAEPYIELESGGASVTLDISTMIKDLDDGNSLNAYFAGDVKIPTNEYIQVDASNIEVPLRDKIGNTPSNYYNRTSVQDTGENISSKSGEGITATGFKKDLIAATGSSGAANAAVTYSFDSNKVIRFTPRASTQYMYGQSGRLGDFYIMVRVIDPSDVSDDGIWFPIAIRVTSAKPAETPTVANFTLDFNDTFVPGAPVTNDGVGSDARQNEPRSIVLTPVSYVGSDGVVRGIGSPDDALNKYTSDKDADHALPFTIDPDTFIYSGEGNDKTRALNDIVMLDGTSIDNIINAYDTAAFYTVERIELYASKTVFSRLSMNKTQLESFGVREHGDCYAFYGLKITPKRSTNGEYFQFDVKVKDSHDAKNTVRVCIKVDNRAVQARRSSYQGMGDDSATFDYKINLANANRKSNDTKNVFMYNPSINAVAVNYYIERNDVLQITPYDLVYDFDVDCDNTVLNAMNAGSIKYNTNPVDEEFPSVAQFLNHQYNIPHTASPSAPATEATGVKLQNLSFTNLDNFRANAEQYAGYIAATAENKCVVAGGAEYMVPCIKIVGVSRTTSAVVQLRFTVTDGFSSTDCLVTIVVNNSAPMLNTEKNHPKENEEDKRIVEPYIMTTELGTKVRNSYMFTTREIAYDKDGDIPTFIAGSARIVAKIGDEYYDRLDYNEATGKFVGAADGKYILSEYAHAQFTKNEYGEDVVQVTALSSTEIFSVPIYLEVGVQDGFRAQPKWDNLHVLIHVNNAQPVFVTDSLTLKDTENDVYAWQIGYEDEAELRVARYIYNSEELYNANPKAAGASNIQYLFSDTDGRENAMLNPLKWSDNINGAVAALVKPVGEKPTDAMFASYPNAAILYTPTYVNDNSGNTHLSLRVIFYVRETDEHGNVVFTELGAADERVKTTQFWAIEIVDSGNSEEQYGPATIAISIKDNHHDVPVYNADKTVKSTGKSASLVLNFDYEYKSPGITVMHTYYRTDGNLEANTAIKTDDNGNTFYAVDYNGFATDKNYQFEGDIPTNQTTLQSATFADDFKYQYFVKTISRTVAGKEKVEVTYKCYPDASNAFYYRPIEIEAAGIGGGVTEVPISYIAMPKRASTSTDSQSVEHVTFANATAGPLDPKNNLVLSDSMYSTWGNNPQTLGYVFENLTLSDIDGNTWSGATLNNNPYITIGYKANTGSYVASDKTKYLNDKRYTISTSDDSTRLNRNPITSIVNGKSIYREDKYGLTFEKKPGGERARNRLKLTVALKTTAFNDNQLIGSAVEYAEVDIILKNAAPSLKYVDETEVVTPIDSGTDTMRLSMTTSDTQGKTLVLRDGNPVEDDNGNLVPTPTGDCYITYDDADKGDVMKFLMSSATATVDDKGNVVGGMSKDERDYITIDSNSGGQKSAAFKMYYDVSYGETVEVDGETISMDKYKEQYVPNPGYDKFFDVSPKDGRSSSIQFTPKAKTQLSFPEGTTTQQREDILAEYHLKEDKNGIYYPFRVLFFDEVNGSSLTEGFWFVTVLKVYIRNDELRINPKMFQNDKGVINTINVGGTYVPEYKFKLSRGADFFIDVSSLLLDNDIKLDGSSFSVSDANFTDEEKYTRDYLVMPTSFRKIDPTGELPITIGSAPEDSGMSESTIMFSADSAFKNPVSVMYTFSDSVRDNTMSVVFTVSYNNEAPTANSDTFGGSESISIVMRTGDSFTLYAADHSKFDSDVRGGFNSWKGNSGYVYNYVNGTPHERPDKNAAELATAFLYDSSGESSASKHLGGLIIGSDDAASTLRIVDYKTFSDINHVDLFSYSTGAMYLCEDGSVGRPMSVTVTAKAVVNTVYTVTLQDGLGVKVEININISVVSTAPTAKLNNLPAGLEVAYDDSHNVIPNTYEIALDYDETKEFDLGGDYGFMTDVDRDDEYHLSVYKGVDNTSFTINNPQGVSAISVESKTEQSVTSIVIKATDYMNRAGLYSSVTFRVADMHGAVSEFITIRVKIKPREVRTIATQDRDLSLELKSYAEYVKDGQPVTIDLVAAGSDAKLFSDSDVAAPSAKYDVNVYALLVKRGENNFEPIRHTSDDFDRDSCLLVSVEGSSIQPGYGEVATYVSRFFSVSLSADGKTLEFIPNSATISPEKNNAALANIQLYIELVKDYRDENDRPMDMKTAFANVSVANSALVAVAESPFNSGYPRVPSGEEGEMRLRESSFLRFTGTAGDSLTWNLYDTQDSELGLFYDYDLIRNPSTSGGLESINYVRAEFRGINETVKGKGDVLSVTPSGDGKSITIKINRKVFTGNPDPNGNEVSYTDVSVDIYCADTIGVRSGISNNKNLVKTTITVRVENDIPELKTVTDSSDILRLGYSLTYTDDTGYVLNATVERGSKLNVRIADIINDADVDMDKYVLLNTATETSLIMSDGNLMGSVDEMGNSSKVGKLKNGNGVTLFNIETSDTSNAYGLTTLDKIMFTCVSTLRGEVGTCQLRLRDSVRGAVTDILTINVTVDNIAPKLKPGIDTHITLMGLGKDATEEDVGNAVKTFSILDFIADDNGDNYRADDPQYAERTPTYAFIDSILVYDRHEEGEDAPIMYGPNLMHTDEEGNTEYTSDTLCYIDWKADNAQHQLFTVTQVAGLYGFQKVTLTIVDSGYEDGSAAGIQDGKVFELNLYITVADPLEDVADELEPISIAYGVTRTVTTEDLLGDKARGYTIKSITEVTDGGNPQLSVFAPGSTQALTSASGADIDEWRIYARTEGASVKLEVEFAAGSVSVKRILPITVSVNTPPKYKKDAGGEKTVYEYTVNMLTDPVNRTLKVYPEDWFEDTDKDDIMTFLTPVVTSQSVIVEALLDYDTAADGGRAFILLKFNRRGSSDISLKVSDSSGRSYDMTITVMCHDAPEQSWFESTISLIEANWMWFWIIVAAILLFIILLIVIIVVVCKKRKMRREIESLLNAEIELEEEMMRLGSGGSAPYQSFGYLPPMQQTVNDPGLMLGGSANNPTPNSLQLNAGSGSTPPPQQGNVPPAQPTAPNGGNPPPASPDGFNPDEF